VGGTASNIAVDATVKSKFDGVVEFDELRTVNSSDDEGNPVQVVMARSGELRITDAKKSKILMSNHVPYGAILKVKNGQKVSIGDELCFWDPYNAVIMSELDGRVTFEAIIEGVTFKEESDEQTGHREKVIIDTKDKAKNPAIIIHSADTEKGYNIPVGAHLAIDEGAEVKAGQVLAKIPRNTGKSRDITGGLPRATELFEARNPSNPAVVTEIDGVVTYGGIKRGNREVFVESKDGIKKRYLVPLTPFYPSIRNDFIKAGEALSDGSITPADILSIQGPTAVQEYLVNEIQEVYRLQGVQINDKHIEVIVRQMLQKWEVTDSGGTTLLKGEQVDKSEFDDLLTLK
jgi:DNA-directed RNA polymerase subunit beta'